MEIASVFQIIYNATFYIITHLFATALKIQFSSPPEPLLLGPCSVDEDAKRSEPLRWKGFYFSLPSTTGASPEEGGWGGDASVYLNAQNMF